MCIYNVTTSSSCLALCAGPHVGRLKRIRHSTYSPELSWSSHQTKTEDITPIVITIIVNFHYIITWIAVSRYALAFWEIRVDVALIYGKYV